MAGMKIYAHRGGPAGGPENTAAAVKAAFAAGADAAECDIRRTADGQFVAFHDAGTARLCGAGWSVAGTEWGHLKTLRVLGGEPIAHLDDLLNILILRPGRELFLELALPRESDAADLALQVARAGVQRRVFLLTYSHRRRLLAAARAAVPDIGTAVMPLLPTDVVGAAWKAGASRVCAGWVDWPLARETFYCAASVFGLRGQAEEAEAAGIELSAGIANHPRDFRLLAGLGAKAVWTDDVELAAKYI